jgi:putative ABC transport system permease protein
MGISTSVILMLIISYDLSYDKHYTHYQNIYRLGARIESSGVDYSTARSAQELSAIIRDEYPEVIVTSLNRSNFCLVQIGGSGRLNEKSFREVVFQTDSSYFYLFDHEFISGDPYRCFDNNQGVVLTESKARSYFGHEDPLGEEISINGEPKIITGVIRDLPGNSHLKFSILSVGLEDRGWKQEDGLLSPESYWSPNVFTYLLLPETYTPQTFIDRFEYVYSKYLKGFGDKIAGNYSPILERLDEIHFNSKLERDEPRGNLLNLLVTVLIGLGILLLSIINYINLATIKSFSRGSEIAIKKIFGSRRRTIIVSLIGESVFYCLVALVVSLGFVSAVIGGSSLNELTERDLNLDLLLDPILLIASVGLACTVGVVSALYPALQISRTALSEILKARFRSKRSSMTFKRSLIIVQFCVSIIAVIFTLVMNQQLRYLKGRSVGFDRDNIVVVPFYAPNAGKEISAFKQDALQHHGILSATTATQSPGSALGVESFLVETKGGMQTKQMRVLYVGDDYLETMGIKLKVGRDFESQSDTERMNSFLLNEAAVKFLELEDDAIGKRMRPAYADEDGNITGITYDFHFESLFTQIQPLVIVKSDEGARLHLKVQAEGIGNTIQSLRDRWLSYDFEFPFEYYFLDEYYNRQYFPHEKQYKLIRILSSLLIFVALLGVFGLSAFSAVQRTREMGIRRVHGASRKGVAWLLYKEVAALVILSSLIIMPISYFVVERWLNNFAYPVAIDLALFTIVLSSALLITFGVVLFNALKICRARPAEVLKCE